MENEIITPEFVNKNINQILCNMRPDLVFEYFSKRFDSGSGWVDSSGWNIQIRNKLELLGEYHNGSCISGLWFDEKQKEINNEKLYELLKEKADKENIEFNKYANQLLCKGKKNKGISWNEYDAVIEIHKQKITEKQEVN